MDKQYRHVKVTVGLPNVTLRFRDGYYPFILCPSSGAQ